MGLPHLTAGVSLRFESCCQDMSHQPSKKQVEEALVEAAAQLASGADKAEEDVLDKADELSEASEKKDDEDLDDNDEADDAPDLPNPDGGDTADKDADSSDDEHSTGAGPSASATPAASSVLNLSPKTRSLDTGRRRRKKRRRRKTRARKTKRRTKTRRTRSRRRTRKTSARRVARQRKLKLPRPKEAVVAGVDVPDCSEHLQHSRCLRAVQPSPHDLLECPKQLSAAGALTHMAPRQILRACQPVALAAT